MNINKLNKKEAKIAVIVVASLVGVIAVGQMIGNRVKKSRAESKELKKNV